MNGLIEVKDIITETGYFYDYECMDMVDLRDEYIVFVSYWDHVNRLYPEDNSLPPIEDVFELGVEIEKIIEDKILNMDFRKTMEFVRCMKRINDIEKGVYKYEQSTEKKVH